MVDNRLGTTIKALREMNHITQTDLARRIGQSRVSVSNLERGVNEMSLDNLETISSAFGLGVGDLLTLAGYSTDDTERLAKYRMVLEAWATL